MDGISHYRAVYAFLNRDLPYFKRQDESILAVYELFVMLLRHKDFAYVHALERDRQAQFFYQRPDPEKCLFIKKAQASSLPSMSKGLPANSGSSFALALPAVVES